MTTKPSIIPQPVEMNVLGNLFELIPSASISYVGTEAEAVATLLAEQLRPATGYPFPVLPGVAGTVPSVF